MKEKRGQCVECDDVILKDDDNCCWNICNTCRNSIAI